MSWWGFLLDGVAIVALYLAGCAASKERRPAEPEPTASDADQDATPAPAADPFPEPPAPSWAAPDREAETGGRHRKPPLIPGQRAA
jgi:hypothetical protein